MTDKAPAELPCEVTQGGDGVLSKLELWFFRECNVGTRRQLFSIFEMPVDEICNDSTERLMFRHILTTAYVQAFARHRTPATPQTSGDPALQELKARLLRPGIMRLNDGTKVETDEYYLNPDGPAAHAAITALELELAGREAELNTPETGDFIQGVQREAAHQRERWGADHDAGKTAFDWFWLIGYLAQKAANSAVQADGEKARHHTISTAAALANWHLALSGVDTRMRPGIGPGNGGEKIGSAYDLAARQPLAEQEGRP